MSSKRRLWCASSTSRPDILFCDTLLASHHAIRRRVTLNTSTTSMRLDTASSLALFHSVEHSDTREFAHSTLLASPHHTHRRRTERMQ